MTDSNLVCLFENCASYARTLAGAVHRPRGIHVDALNEQGKPVSIDATGSFARLLQHAVDHLKAIMFTSKIVNKSLVQIYPLSEAAPPFEIAAHFYGLTLPVRRAA